MSMRIALIVAAGILGAGCSSSGDDRIIHGGGDDVVIDHHDAAVPDGNDAVTSTDIMGRACLLVDSRDPRGCANDGAGNLTVTLGPSVGGTTTTTANDGTFTIADPGGSSLAWHVVGPTTGTPFEISTMSRDTGTLIPVFTTDGYVGLLDGTIGTQLAPGQGSIFVHVLHGGLGLAGASATSSSLESLPLYATLGLPDSWNQGAAGGTSTFGMVWIPIVDIGSATVTITPPTGTPIALTIPVEDQTITYFELTVL